MNKIKIIYIIEKWKELYKETYRTQFSSESLVIFYLTHTHKSQY